MTDWVRLWHDMPEDQKWRLIARRSGQSIGNVIAVFNFMLVNASSNEEDRGTLHNFNHEVTAVALDIDEEQVDAIRVAMEGRVIDGDRLSGWETRQPKREDASTERVRNFRKRNETQRNASDAESEPDTEIPPLPPVGGFEKFWDVYPHKVEEDAARLAFAEAEQTETAEAICAGAVRYAVNKPTGQHWKKAALWLKAKRWNDQYGTVLHIAPAAKPATASGVCTYEEMVAKRGKQATRQADDGGGFKPISSIAPTILLPIEGTIS